MYEMDSDMLNRPRLFTARHRLIAALAATGVAWDTSAQGNAQIAPKPGGQRPDGFALPSVVLDSVRG